MTHLKGYWMFVRTLSDKYLLIQSDYCVFDRTHTSYLKYKSHILIKQFQTCENFLMDHRV